MQAPLCVALARIVEEDRREKSPECDRLEEVAQAVLPVASGRSDLGRGAEPPRPLASRLANEAAPTTTAATSAATRMRVGERAVQISVFTTSTNIGSAEMKKMPALCRIRPARRKK